MLEISITVDSNDGDHRTAVNQISEDDLDKFDLLFRAIKGFEPYIGTKEDWKYKHDSNWPVGECLRSDLGEKSPKDIYPDVPSELFDIFEDYLPYPEYGFHTIVEIMVCPVQYKTILV